MKPTTRVFFCFVVFLAVSHHAIAEPRVFVFTDINIDVGDPDDRQSLVHLLWYADELQIEGIVPDRWNAQGYEACELAIQAYAADYAAFRFSDKDYPEPDALRKHVAIDHAHAEALFVQAASTGKEPLWVLVWGNMTQVGTILKHHPELADRIRLVTIGTHLMFEEHRAYLPEGWERTDEPCEQPNWNGHGRNALFDDPRFQHLWWLEINWTYEGMFTGEDPSRMFEKLLPFGALGAHMQEVVRNQAWARYFRVGDTPSVLYLIDPDHDADDPTQASWAGQFTRPFPEQRPHYFTDASGPVPWDYQDPCKTWDNHIQVRAHAKSTLEAERPEMYAALLEKLKRLYGLQSFE